MLESLVIEHLLKEHMLFGNHTDVEKDFKDIHASLISYQYRSIDSLLPSIRKKITDDDHIRIPEYLAKVRQGREICERYERHPFSMPISDEHISCIQEEITRLKDEIPSFLSLYWKAFKKERINPTDPDVHQKNRRHKAKNHAKTYLALLDAAGDLGMTIRWSKGKRSDTESYISQTDYSEQAEIRMEEEKAAAELSDMKDTERKLAALPVDPSLEELRYVSRTLTDINRGLCENQGIPDYLDHSHRQVQEHRQKWHDSCVHIKDSLISYYNIKKESLNSILGESPSIDTIQAYKANLVSAREKQKKIAEKISVLDSNIDHMMDDKRYESRIREIEGVIGSAEAIIASQTQIGYSSHLEDIASQAIRRTYQMNNPQEFSFSGYMSDLGFPHMYILAELRTIATMDKPWMERLALIDEKIPKLIKPRDDHDNGYLHGLYNGLMEESRSGILSGELEKEGNRGIFEGTMKKFETYLSRIN